MSTKKNWGISTWSGWHHLHHFRSLTDSAHVGPLGKQHYLRESSGVQLSWVQFRYCQSNPCDSWRHIEPWNIDFLFIKWGWEMLEDNVFVRGLCVYEWNQKVCVEWSRNVRLFPPPTLFPGGRYSIVDSSINSLISCLSMIWRRTKVRQIYHHR